MIKANNSGISDLKDEFLIFKEIIIKLLQEENQKLSSKHNKVEKVVFDLEKNLNNLNQYGWRNIKNYQGRNINRRSMNRRNMKTNVKIRRQRKKH